MSDERKRNRRSTAYCTVDRQTFVRNRGYDSRLTDVCRLLLHHLSSWVDLVWNGRSASARTLERGSQVAQRKLEGRITSIHPTLLPLHQGLSGKGRGICRHEDSASANKAGCSEPNSPSRPKSKTGTGVLTMPNVTIGPDEHVRLKYSVPKSRLVEFEINANLPVKSYVLGPTTLASFSAGSETFEYYGGFADPRKTQRQTVRLPFAGSWYLVIMNPSKRHSVEVDYEVFY